MEDPRLASMSPEELRQAMRTLGYRTQADLANEGGVAPRRYAREAADNRYCNRQV